MKNTVPFPTPSQSASQQYTFVAPSGLDYVLHKLPATRYLMLSNALTAYFGESFIKTLFVILKAKAEGTETARSEEELTETLVSQLGSLKNVPLDAFQNLARLVCPFVERSGKPPVHPDELNVKMVDAKIDLLFEECSSDVLPVVGRAIAFNMADFFSGAGFRLTPKHPKV